MAAVPGRNLKPALSQDLASTPLKPAFFIEIPSVFVVWLGAAWKHIVWPCEAPCVSSEKQMKPVCLPLVSEACCVLLADDVVERCRPH